MSEPQLIQEQPPARPTPPAPPVDWTAVVLQVGVVLVLFAAVGALAGVVWNWVWTPPTGLVYHHRWFPDETGVRGMFSGTGWYVLVGVVAGTVAGVVAGFLLALRELVTLVAVVAGSVLGGLVMWHVGTALGPTDPSSLAAHLPDYHKLVGSLRTSGDSYRIAFPTGGLLGVGAVFLGFSGRRAGRE